MEKVVDAFFRKASVHVSLDCGPFDFDCRQDLIKANQADPGMYVRGHELLRLFQSTHRHALMLLDAEWSGSPGAARIESDVREKLCHSGWREGEADVIAIDPELEAWIWIDSIHTAQALGHSSYEAVRQWLHEKKMWPTESVKPPDPKAAVESVLRERRKPRSSAIYAKIIEQASVQQCVDPAFARLQKIFQR